MTFIVSEIDFEISQRRVVGFDLSNDGRIRADVCSDRSSADHFEFGLIIDCYAVYSEVVNRAISERQRSGTIKSRQEVIRSGKTFTPWWNRFVTRRLIVVLH